MTNPWLDYVTRVIAEAPKPTPEQIRTIRGAFDRADQAVNPR